MIVRIVRGLPGSGKTHFRLEKLSNLPSIDLDDLRDQEEERELGFYKAYKERMHRLFSRLMDEKSKGTPVLVVEGIFAPGSESERWLMDFCGDNDIEVVAYTQKVDVNVCARRVCEDYLKDCNLDRLIGRISIIERHKKSF